jgi:hypothetical protein
MGAEGQKHNVSIVVLFIVVHIALPVLTAARLAHPHITTALPALKRLDDVWTAYFVTGDTIDAERVTLRALDANMLSVNPALVKTVLLQFVDPVL